MTPANCKFQPEYKRKKVVWFTRLLGLALADNFCEAIHMRLAMMQTALRAYNASSQLVSSAKSTFVENPKARKVKRVGMVNLYRINGIETRHGLPEVGLSITELKTEPRTIPWHSRDQQYKIVFHARHKLRAPLIRSRTIRQSSCIDSSYTIYGSCNISIQFVAI